MSVSIAFLSEALIAILANEGANATMHADVIHDVAEFSEGITASSAH